METLEPIYTAGGQLKRVRFFMGVCAIVFIGCTYWSYDLLQHYGLSPGDGGVLRPIGERLAWGLGVFLLGLFLVLAMDLYGRKYIARVFYDPSSHCLEVETVRWWGRATKRYAENDVVRASYHRGHLATDSHTVNAPWYYVRFKGERLAHILDAQGEFLDFKLTARLLGL